MKVLGCIIAGGKSSRMGQDKALADLWGKPIIQHVIDIIRPQVSHLIINSKGPDAKYTSTGLNELFDLYPHCDSPLNGMLSCLRMAKEIGFDGILTVPADCPFLPNDLAEGLVQFGEATGAATAYSNQQTHYLTGFWHIALATQLEDAMANKGLIRVKDWCALAKAKTVEWPLLGIDPFFNVNTPEDLAEAARMARRH